MKKAILLMSMGGPDRLESVQPFLFNLFKDKAIIRLPTLWRYVLAFIISRLHAKTSKENYEKIGGCSPLLQNTKKQAVALELALNNQRDGHEYTCFVGMSYWHPFIKEAVDQMKPYDPDEVYLLPLYPQFSTTTTASVLSEAHKRLKGIGEKIPVKEISSFHIEEGYIQALSELIEKKWKNIKLDKKHLLFSAHGLPLSIVEDGDPYPEQCAETMEAVLDRLPFSVKATLCYQSKVGPQKWLEPSLRDEIDRAATKGEAVLIVPLSFVSEHVETRVELKMDYKNYAKKVGLPFYDVVETVGVHPNFISGLVQKLTKT